MLSLSAPRRFWEGGREGGREGEREGWVEFFMNLYSEESFYDKELSLESVF